MSGRFVFWHGRAQIWPWARKIGMSFGPLFGQLSPWAREIDISVQACCEPRGGAAGLNWAYIYLYVHYIESQNQIAIFTRAVLSPQDTIYIRTGMILNQNFMLKTNIDRYNVLPCAPLLLMTDTFRPGQTAPLCMSTSIDYQGSQGTSERSILRSNIQNTGTRTHIDAHPSPAIRFPP